MSEGSVAGGSTVRSRNCKEVRMLRHKGIRERAALDEGELHEDDQSHGILWAVWKKS